MGNWRGVLQEIEDLRSMGLVVDAALLAVSLGMVRGLRRDKSNKRRRKRQARKKRRGWA